MGTYRFTIRISPREADLWPSGQAFDQATRSTQAWERIYVGERDGIAKETSPKTGAILQIHALASGSRRDKTGRVIPGTAAHFFGQLPRIIRQPWSAVHLTGILETGPLVNDIAKNNRRFTPGTPYFAWDVDPHRHSRRWFLYQPAQDGHADLIGSPFAVSNPKGVNPA